MDRDTAIAWASRVAHEQFTADRINKVWQIIERKVKPYGSRFSFVGEERHAEFMVVTRRATFPKGYKGMDPSLIPQFKEGEQEKEAAGRGRYAFSIMISILDTHLVLKILAIWNLRRVWTEYSPIFFLK